MCYESAKSTRNIQPIKRHNIIFKLMSSDIFYAIRQNQSTRIPTIAFSIFLQHPRMKRSRIIIIIMQFITRFMHYWFKRLTQMPRFHSPGADLLAVTVLE